MADTSKAARYEVTSEPQVKKPSLFATELETSCYGEIEFVGPGSGPGQGKRKFVKVDSKTDCKKLLHALNYEWNLNNPNLLISVTGGAVNFPLNKRLREILRKGIVEAAVNTKAWIISGGTYTGVMKYVGEAVRDYQTECRRNDVVAIGVATWGILDQTDLLIDLDDNGDSLAYISTTRQGNDHEVLLDPNHTHFILVDDVDGSKGKFGVEIELRAKLEKQIKTKQKLSMLHEEVDDKSQNVPAVCVVVEGGPNTIKTVYEAIRNDTPVIVVAESGRAANALTLAFQCAEFQTNRKEMVLSPAARRDVLQLLRKIKDEISQEELDKSMDYIDTCLKKPHLLTVFDQSCGIDIIGSILKALMKANQDNQEDQLFLAQALNQVDIARNELFGSSAHIWKEDKLDKNLHYALIKNQPEFVKLFIENGVSLKAYLSQKELTNLYNEVKQDSILHECLCTVRSKNTNTDRQFNLKDVNQVIQQLSPMNAGKQRYDYVDPGEVEADVTETSFQAPTLGLTRRRPASIIARKAATPQFSHPAAELFLYAVLNQFDEIARIFWEIENENMASALVASAIFKQMAHFCQARDEETMTYLINLSKEYENLAINIQSECYSKDRRRTSLLLIRTLHNWGGETCLSLAIAGKNLNFIAHSGVQNLLKEIWYFGISEENSALKLWLCSILPIIIPCLITFRPDLVDPQVSIPKTGKSSKYTGILKSGYVDEDIQLKTLPLPPNRGSTAKFLSTRKRTDIGIILAGDQALTRWQRIKFFYISPRMTFKLNVLFYLLFLGFYSYVMLSGSLAKHQPSVYEYILFVWVGTMILDLFRQVIHQEASRWYLRLSQSISGSWNRLDLCLFVVFAMAIPFRFIDNETTHQLSRLILAFDLVGFYARVLKSFSYFRKLGPKIIMIGEMFLDMYFFICILFVFLGGFGVAMEAIQYPHYTDLQNLIRVVLHRPYFQIHGALFLDEITATPDDGSCTSNKTEVGNGVPLCPEHNEAATVLLAIYLSISNILLLTLLVAMFSYTFQRIQENTDIVWKYQRYLLTREYFYTPMLPPPFVIFSHAAMVVRGLSHKCQKLLSWKRNKLNVELTQKHIDELINWEARQADKCIFRERQKAKEDMDKRIGNLTGRSVNEKADVENGLSIRLTQIEEQLKKTTEAINLMMRSLEENNIIASRSETIRLKSTRNKPDSNA